MPVLFSSTLVIVEITKTTERGGESVVTMLKHF
jgi:hypothetical protein